MYSRPSTPGSRAGTARTQRAAVAAAAALLVSGCGDRGGDRGAGSAPAPAAQQRAFVRLDVLAGRHPLQEDVRRLDEAARRLSRAAGTPPGAPGPASAAAAYTVPPLTAVGVAGDGGQFSILAQRRAAARARFAARAARGIEEYDAAQEFRRQRRREQRRAELEAVAQGRVQEQERAARDAAQERSRRTLLASADYYVRLRSFLSALVTDLDGSVPLTSPRRPTPEELEEQIARITPPGLRPLGQIEGMGPEAVADQGRELEDERAAIREAWKGPFVSNRARLTLALRRTQGRLDELQAWEERVVARGRSDADEEVARIRAAAAAEVEAQLRALRASFRARDTIGLERRNIGATLTLERDAAEAARRTLRGSAAGSVTLAGQADAAPPSGRLGVTAAVQRIEQQKARLRAVASAETADAVRDAAAARNIEVTFNGNGGDGTMDRTQDFLVWTGLAQGRLAPLNPPATNNDRSGGRGQ